MGKPLAITYSFRRQSDRLSHNSVFKRVLAPVKQNRGFLQIAENCVRVRPKKNQPRSQMQSVTKIMALNGSAFLRCLCAGHDVFSVNFNVKSLEKDYLTHTYVDCILVNICLGV